MSEVASEANSSARDKVSRLGRRSVLRLAALGTAIGGAIALPPGNVAEAAVPLRGQAPAAPLADTYTTAALATLNKPGQLTVSVGTTKYPLPVGTRIIDAIATLGTAPLSRAVVISLMLDGRPIFSKSPTIDAGSTASTRMSADLITTVPAGGGMLTCNVDQVGAQGKITYVSSTTASTVSGTTTSVAKPVGTQPGDILLAGIYVDTTATNTFPPIGWTQAGAALTLPSGQTFSVFWIRTDTEPGPYLFTTSISSNTKAACVAYRGCVIAGNPVVEMSSQNTSYTSTINSPSLSAPSDSMLVHFNGIPQHPATVTTDSRASTRIGSALGNYVVVCDEAWASAGSTGSRTHNLSAPANSNNLSVALLPAPIDGAGKDMVVAVRYQVKG